MRTLLLVLSHPAAQEIVDMNGLTWGRSGCDVVGIEHEDKPPMRWPGNQIGERIGTDPGKTPHGWIDRFVKVLEWCLNEHCDYERFSICEADTFFVRPIPHRHFFTATLAGHRDGPFLGEHYYHCPWTMSMPALLHVYDKGLRMLRAGLSERGFIDRWLGLMADLYPDWRIADSGYYSRNTILPQHIDEARAAMENQDCFALHGVKTKEVFDALTK